MNDKKVDAAIAAYQKLGKYASTRARMGAALTAAEQAEPAPAARYGAVKVKALEWENGEADTIIGTYKVKKDSSSDWRTFREGWTLYSSPTVPAIFGSEDEAKAAAQADYERRILSALEPAEPEVMCVGCEGKPSLGNSPCAVCGKQAAEPATDADPVAWLMREQGTTVTLNKVQADEWGWDGKDIQPLFTRPPESRLREALEEIARGLSLTFTSSPTKMSGNEAQEIARAALAQGADDERS